MNKEKEVLLPSVASESESRLLNHSFSSPLFRLPFHKVVLIALWEFNVGMYVSAVAAAR